MEYTAVRKGICLIYEWHNDTKCLPVLLYGTEVCPTNASDLQSMQFTVDRVIIKLFGTMSQNYYQEVSNYFGINTVK